MLKGKANQLRTVFELQLAENVTEMSLNRPRADKQMLTNLLVGKPLNRLPKHFFFSRGER